MSNWKKRTPLKEYNEKDSVINKLVAINGIEDVFTFLNPTEDELHSPYLLKNAELLRDRIVKAIEDDEYISIYADVDPDGISSTSIMYQYLSNYSNKVKYFYVQRSAGHGIQYGIDLIPEGTQLLIIVDSSSNEEEQCCIIQERGIDVLIIDHHQITYKNEHCILVNPQQEGCTYPNKQASGSLLCWKVCQLLDDYFHENHSDSLADLAAFGLYSDMQSMRELENRFMVSYLLDNIHNVGLKAILKVAGKEKEKLYASTIGYNLTPFINAPTRLDQIELPLELLITDDPEIAVDLANKIKKLNDERKRIQKEAVKRLRPLINEEDSCIVLVDNTLGKGYNGLVANDLAGIYKRPIIIQNESEHDYSGSFRSYGGFDFLSFASGLNKVANAGGHAEAGGVTVNKSDHYDFKNELQLKLKDVNFDNVLYYDCELEAEKITEKLVTQVQNFSRISGTGFEEATFLVRDLIVNQKKVIGSGDTLRLGCLFESDTWFMSEKDIREAKPSITLLKFKADEEFIDKVSELDKIEVVGSLNLNAWVRYKPKYEVVKSNQIFIQDLIVNDKLGGYKNV